MKERMAKFFKSNILLIFLFFTIFLVSLGVLYYLGLNPADKKIIEITNKFKTENYVLPYYVAERYLTWYNMRTFFFSLNYILTLLGIVASLMTVFYASKDVENNGDSESNRKAEKRKQSIIFLALLSTCFTVANIFINSGSMAYMAQHAWRNLDSCIMKTINDSSLSSEEKDKIIIEEVIEMEKYIESYEH